MAKNEWKPIKGFNGSYEVNQYGEIRCRKTDHYRKLKPKLNKKTGYLFVNLYDSNKSQTKTVHRIVAEAFIPNPDCLPYVNHIDEDKQNNVVENLEWCTPQYNSEYSKRKKYKQIDVFTIDGEYIATFASHKAAAEMLGVCKAMVSQAVKGNRKTCCGYLLKPSNRSKSWV